MDFLDLRQFKNYWARRSNREAPTCQGALNQPPGAASLRRCANHSTPRPSDVAEREQLAASISQSESPASLLLSLRELKAKIDRIGMRSPAGMPVPLRGAYPCALVASECDSQTGVSVPLRISIAARGALRALRCFASFATLSHPDGNPALRSVHRNAYPALQKLCASKSPSLHKLRSSARLRAMARCAAHEAAQLFLRGFRSCT